MRVSGILLALFSIVLLTACGTSYRMERVKMKQPSAWPFHRNQADSRGAAPDGPFSGKLDVVWEFESNDKPGGPLTIYNKNLIYPGTRKKIKFIEAGSGKYQGHLKVRGVPHTGLVIVDSLGFVAVSPEKADLSCFNLLKGTRQWRRDIKDAAGGSIIVDNLLIVGSGSRLEAFTLFDGNQVWSLETEDIVDLPAAFGSGKLFQSSGSNLYAVSPTDGAVLYRREFDSPLTSGVAIGQYVITGDISGMVHAIRPEDGSIAWSRSVGGPVWSPPTIADGRVFVGHSAGSMVALNESDGAVEWRFEATEVIRAAAVVAGDFLVFGTMSGQLYSLRAADGSLVEKREVDGAISTGLVTDGSRVFVATDKGVIVCCGEKDGNNSPPDQREHAQSEHQ